MTEYSEILKDINIQIYADGADLEEMRIVREQGYVSGFTTNPTLMKKAGVTDYFEFAKHAIKIADGLPISFEVFTDDIEEMVEQASTLSALGDNIYVKIPVMNTKGQMTYPIIERLDKMGVNLNVTAVFTVDQVQQILQCVSGNTRHIISVFAGRIADTSVDPLVIMNESLTKIREHSQNIKLLWASPREILNLYQADNMGCDIITITPSLLSKLKLRNKNLHEFSRETVLMFYNDALESGFKI